MIKKVDWDSLKVRVIDSYTKVANKLSLSIRKGNYQRIVELRFIVLTRYVRIIELQNVKPDINQISDGYKDYNEESIIRTLNRINVICGTTFNVPYVYNAILDAIADNNLPIYLIIDGSSAFNTNVGRTFDGNNAFDFEVNLVVDGGVV